MQFFWRVIYFRSYELGYELNNLYQNVLSISSHCLAVGHTVQPVPAWLEEPVGRWALASMACSRTIHPFPQWPNGCQNCYIVLPLHIPPHGRWNTVSKTITKCQTKLHFRFPRIIYMPTIETGFFYTKIGTKGMNHVNYKIFFVSSLKIIWEKLFR